MTWATSVPILVFLCLSVLDLGPMYATDRRQTKASLNASALWGQRHRNNKHHSITNFTYKQKIQMFSTVYLPFYYRATPCISADFAVARCPTLKIGNNTVYQMVPLSMTLSDLWPGFQGHDIFQHCISQKRHDSHIYYRTSIGKRMRYIEW